MTATAMNAPFRLPADPNLEDLDTVAALYVPGMYNDDLRGSDRNLPVAYRTAKALVENGDKNEEPETLFADMITNMYHLADLLGLDMDELVERGHRIYVDEINSEF